MPTRSDRSIDRALSRAVLCRALRTALSPPEEAGLDALFSAAGSAALEAAAGALEGDRPGGLTGAVTELTGSPRPSPSSLRRAHERLFGHTLRGLVCPYECEYGARMPLQQAQELADLAGFYRAFGLALGAGAGNRVDHIVCELEFLEFLSRKEALALELGDGEMAETTRRAVRDFLRRHLGRFGRSFARTLGEALANEFYLRVAKVCDAFLTVECARVGVSAGSELLELCSVERDPAPMACGGEDSLVQIGGR